MSASEFNNPFIDNLITVKLRNNNELNTLTLRVTKDPISTQSIIIGFYDITEEIKVDETKILESKYTPSDASYQATTYEIIKIIKHNNEVIVGEEILSYAMIKSGTINGIVITTTDIIQVGYKIYVVGYSGTGPGIDTSVKNNNELEIIVSRTPVSAVGAIWENENEPDWGGERFRFWLKFNDYATAIEEGAEIRLTRGQSFGQTG